MQVQDNDGRLNFVTVKMGNVTFSAPISPWRPASREVVTVPLDVAQERPSR